MKLARILERLDTFASGTDVGSMIRVSFSIIAFIAEISWIEAGPWLGVRGWCNLRNCHPSIPSNFQLIRMFRIPFANSLSILCRLIASSAMPS